MPFSFKISIVVEAVEVLKLEGKSFFFFCPLACSPRGRGAQRAEKRHVVFKTSRHDVEKNRPRP
jgi:hypothetical protein